MNILVTGIGGPTPRSIARAVRREYPQATIIGVDSNSRALGFFMPGLLDKAGLVPRADAGEGYFEALQQLIVQESVDFAIVQPESEVLAWGEYFEKEGYYPCPVVIPPAAYTRSLADKAAMANLLAGTSYIPRTICITPDNPLKQEIREQIGYPCWIRASIGSGGLGSLKLESESDLEAWLLIHKGVRAFTVSEFLPGKHLANQMLYLDGLLQMNAGLECVEYVMADTAPSKVTGNTSFGRLIYDERLLGFCEEVIDYIHDQLSEPPHGVYSFDLKLDAAGNPKVTEINIRHMAYTGILAECGCDFVQATINYLVKGHVLKKPIRHRYSKEFVFLRDVDIEPIVLSAGELQDAAPRYEDSSE